MYQVDDNAEPVFPHKSLQHLSDTSFDSAFESDHSPSMMIQENPPTLPPLLEIGEGGLMLAHEEEKEH